MSKAFVFVKPIAFEHTDVTLARVRFAAMQALHDRVLEICACCGGFARAGDVRPSFLMDELDSGSDIWAFVLCSNCPKADRDTPEVRANFTALHHPMTLAQPRWGVVGPSWC